MIRQSASSSRLPPTCLQGQSALPATWGVMRRVSRQSNRHEVNCFTGFLAVAGRLRGVISNHLRFRTGRQCRLRSLITSLRISLSSIRASTCPTPGATDDLRCRSSEFADKTVPNTGRNAARGRPRRPFAESEWHGAHSRTCRARRRRLPYFCADASTHSWRPPPVAHGLWRVHRLRPLY